METNFAKVPVGISNRHIHLSQKDLEVLFGEGAELTPIKDLSQIGQFAAEETLTVVGPKSSFQGVRVLGPVREKTQIEVSRTDAFALGVKPPLRESGDLGNTPGCVLVGPKGALILDEGVVIVKNHIHMSPEEASQLKLEDQDQVNVLVEGERQVVFRNVLIRVHENFRLEMHVDTDEANAAMLKNGALVTLMGRTRVV